MAIGYQLVIFLIFHKIMCSLKQIPGGSDLYSYYVDFETKKLEPWDKIIQAFTFNSEVCAYVNSKTSLM